MDGRGDAPDLVERPLTSRELKLGTGTVLALAGLASLGAADASAMPADNGPAPTTKKTFGSKPSGGGRVAPVHTDASDGYAGMYEKPLPRPAVRPTPPPRPASPAPKAYSPPPIHTDASDGYAGMHDKPAAKPRPTPAPQPKPATTPGRRQPKVQAPTPEPAASAPAPSPRDAAPVPAPPAPASPTHTDASDGYEGLHDPPAPEPVAQPAPVADRQPVAQPAPPTHTDASDGYAGLRDRPAAEPDRPVRAKPGSPLAKPVGRQVRDDLGKLGVQPAPPPAQLPDCLAPAYVAEGPRGQPVEKPHAEPADPDRGPGWDPDHGYGPKPDANRAKLSDVVDLAGAVVGKPWDPIHHPIDTITTVPVLKVAKVPSLALRIFRGGKQAEEATEAATGAARIAERPRRAPDAENPVIQPPAPAPAPPKVRVSERELRRAGRNPDGTRRDLRQTTREDRPDLGELRRRGDELYERRTSGLKNSQDVDLLKNKAEIVRRILDILNHLGG